MPSISNLAIAGLRPHMGQGDGFTMVICDPNGLVAPVHPKAMITVLDETFWDRWLRGSYDDVVTMQRSYPAEKMTVRGAEFPTHALDH